MDADVIAEAIRRRWYAAPEHQRDWLLLDRLIVDESARALAGLLAESRVDAEECGDGVMAVASAGIAGRLRAMADPQHGAPVETGDAGPALLDLARHDREDDFRWLARSAGVPESLLDRLWATTRARVAAPLRPAS